jgi:hypothetical protein
MRIGIPSSDKNCFGCGPAIRVPSPAAGRIANTCITSRVYNLANGDERSTSAQLSQDLECSVGISVKESA